MSLKFKTSIPTASFEAAETDLVTSACEALEAKEHLNALGVQCAELDQIADNIKFARDTIKRQGIRAYFYSVDPENMLAKTFGLEEYKPGLGLAKMKEIEAKWISGAEEGLKEAFVKAWHTFTEFCVEFWNQIKKFFKAFMGLKSNDEARAKSVSEKASNLTPEAKTKLLELKPNEGAATEAVSETTKFRLLVPFDQAHALATESPKDLLKEMGIVRKLANELYDMYRSISNVQPEGLKEIQDMRREFEENPDKICEKLKKDILSECGGQVKLDVEIDKDTLSCKLTYKYAVSGMVNAWGFGFKPGVTLKDMKWTPENIKKFADEYPKCLKGLEDFQKELDTIPERVTKGVQFVDKKIDSLDIPQEDIAFVKKYTHLVISATTAMVRISAMVKRQLDHTLRFFERVM